MKFVRFGAPGREKPGLVDRDGAVRDLSSLVADVGSAQLRDSALQRLRSLVPQTLPLAPAGVRLGCPLAGIGKVIAIGLNYADHAAEAGLAIPSEPVVFTKATSAITGPDDPVVLPPGAVKGDWEVELALVIGKMARHVPRAAALDHVFGYMLANDVSEREWQWDHGGTWDKGKGFDTFLPLGPWLVTRDEIADPQALDMQLDVNGERRQSGNTRTMIFDCATLVEYVSRLVTLLPGDVVITGTPPGVGMGMKPPQYLRAGDVMSLHIAGLGRQRQQVHAWDPARLPSFE
jgi:2-keto-4-pentenoate hydratase/2-oxohepta-3-ene-1,7-dioic acid hydratase in catechol pathway